MWCVPFSAPNRGSSPGTVERCSHTGLSPSEMSHVVVAGLKAAFPEDPNPLGIVDNRRAAKLAVMAILVRSPFRLRCRRLTKRCSCKAAGDSVFLDPWLMNLGLDPSKSQRETDTVSAADSTA